MEEWNPLGITGRENSGTDKARWSAEVWRVAAAVELGLPLRRFLAQAICQQALDTSILPAIFNCSIAHSIVMRAIVPGMRGRAGA